MAAMVLFPMYFLKSFAYAGIATVAFAARRRRSWSRPRRSCCSATGSTRSTSADWCVALRRRPNPAPKPVEQSVLVPLDEVRHAPRRPGRLAVVAFLLAARRAVPRREVGLPRRPGAADARRPRTRSATNCATTSPTTSSTAVTVVVPDAGGLTPTTLDALRRRPVPGARRVGGVRADRHVRRR